jgi:hypothetical protein
LLRRLARSRLQFMKYRFSYARTFSLLCSMLVLISSPNRLLGQPIPAATSAFNLYIATVESRLRAQHSSPEAFLAPTAPASQAELRLRQGEPIIEQLSPSGGSDLPGALLHHWRGTAFVSGAKPEDLERLMKDFNTYPQHFSPEVLRASVLTQQGDHLEATMRVRQRHVITVVMDTAYDITFGRLDAQHGYSISRSTRISEMESPGTNSERALNPSQEHGFLWRQNIYWSYEERDGGLYMQVESISLTRSIPRGLGWAVQPFVESIPRESLEFTLRSTCNALHK